MPDKIGVTRKVSLTLPGEYWDALDGLEGDSRSSKLRDVVVWCLDDWGAVRSVDVDSARRAVFGAVREDKPKP